MRNEKYKLAKAETRVLCEQHSKQHDIVDGDLEWAIGDSDKPCDDCQTAMLMKNEVRAAIADVLLSERFNIDITEVGFEQLADALQQRLDALIDADLLRVAIHEK